MRRQKSFIVHASYDSILIRFMSSSRQIRRPGLQMESLYDVFSAIRDDEGDHVGTMEACLDPTVAKLSPSLERKVLTGIATAAAVSLFLTAGDTGGVDVDQIVDGVDFAVDETGATTLIDGVIAGIAGMASSLGEDDEGATAQAIADLFEEGAIAEVKNAVVDFFVFISRFFL